MQPYHTYTHSSGISGRRYSEYIATEFGSSISDFRSSQAGQCQLSDMILMINNSIIVIKMHHSGSKRFGVVEPPRTYDGPEGSSTSTLLHFRLPF